MKLHLHVPVGCILRTSYVGDVFNRIYIYTIILERDYKHSESSANRRQEMVQATPPHFDLALYLHLPRLQLCLPTEASSLAISHNVRNVSSSESRII